MFLSYYPSEKNNPVFQNGIMTGFIVQDRGILGTPIQYVIPGKNKSCNILKHTNRRTIPLECSIVIIPVLRNLQ